MRAICAVFLKKRHKLHKLPCKTANIQKISKKKCCQLAFGLQKQSVMKELWTAQVHLLTPPSTGGNTRCCTNVVAWAESANDYQLSLLAHCAHRSWSILSIQRCKRVANCIPLSDEFAVQIERAENHPGSCVYGTLYYYPSKPC